MLFFHSPQQIVCGGTVQSSHKQLLLFISHKLLLLHRPYGNCRQMQNPSAHITSSEDFSHGSLSSAINRNPGRWFNTKINDWTSSASLKRKRKTHLISPLLHSVTKAWYFRRLVLKEYAKIIYGPLKVFSLMKTLKNRDRLLLLSPLS